MKQEITMEWQTIDSAPRDGTAVLVCGQQYGTWKYSVAKFDERLFSRWLIEPQVWEGDGDRGGLAETDFEPTHYIPLPTPPAQPDDGE